MKFGFNENKILPQLIPEQVHNEFIKPFDKDEVLAQFANEGLSFKDSYGFDLNELYYKELPGDLKYQIFGGRSDDKSKLDFKILFNLNRKNDKSIHSQLMFTEEPLISEDLTDDGEPKKVWNMHHRLINSKEVGISGTDFFSKAEEYLRILKNKGMIQTSTIGAEVSQPKVLNWLEKKGFILTKNNNVNPSEILLNPNYTLIPVEDRSCNEYKDEYIVKRDWINDSEFKSKWKKYYVHGTKQNEGKQVIVLDKNNMRAGGIIYELINKGYMPQFVLKKEL